MTLTEDAASSLLADAVETYYIARKDWLQARLEGTETAAKTRLHNSVLNLYLAMEPYRDHGAIERHWRSATISIEGREAEIDSLVIFLEDRVVEEPKAMFEGSELKRYRTTLEPGESLDAGQTLTRLARHLGVDIGADESEEYEQEYDHLVE